MSFEAELSHELFIGDPLAAISSEPPLAFGYLAGRSMLRGSVRERLAVDAALASTTTHATEAIGGLL